MQSFQAQCSISPLRAFREIGNSPYLLCQTSGNAQHVHAPPLCAKTQQNPLHDISYTSRGTCACKEAPGSSNQEMPSLHMGTSLRIEGGLPVINPTGTQFVQDGISKTYVWHLQRIYSISTSRRSTADSFVVSPATPCLLPLGLAEDVTHVLLELIMLFCG